ncbi:HD domain-containing protein [Primorskyibacter sp. S87]|uniref:HD domain-containing protein n=1 Tax=Primorskyibacter sp. S87 TaxID=3415126 RepID=UPI003C7A1AE4
MEKVKFTQMKDGDKEDYRLLDRLEREYTKETANRLLGALVELDESLSGYQITRLGHSVQSATRAWRDGADTDWIVAALLHDIGDIFAPHNHDEYAATILKPFVREQVTWCVQAHGDFQLRYFGEHVGADPNKRESHKGSPYFDDCSEFCERWDQASFDPSYPSKSLDFFSGLVREVFSRTPYDPAVIRAGAREPLTNEARAAERKERGGSD